MGQRRERVGLPCDGRKHLGGDEYRRDRVPAAVAVAPVAALERGQETERGCGRARARGDVGLDRPGRRLRVRCPPGRQPHTAVRRRQAADVREAAADRPPAHAVPAERLDGRGRVVRVGRAVRSPRPAAGAALLPEQVAHRGALAARKREHRPHRRVDEPADPPVGPPLALEPVDEAGGRLAESAESEDSEREVRRVPDWGVAEVGAGRARRGSSGRTQPEDGPRRQRRIRRSAALREAAVSLLAGGHDLCRRRGNREDGGEREQLHAHATSTRRRRP